MVIKELPNLMLFGIDGVGKGFFVDILLAERKLDFMKINASDEGLIEDMREKVKNFAMTMGLTKIKIVYFNEADRLSKPAQDMLLQLIEDVHKITRFIFVGNDITQIIPELRSRCEVVELANPPAEQIDQRCRWILNAEGVTSIDKSALDKIIKEHYPDMRKIINTLKMNVEDGKLLAFNNQECKQESQQQPQTKYPGTHRRGKKWAAQIRIGKKVKYIGTYNTPEEAHQAFLEEKRRLN
jgi:DNA polymerase III delta prime subunit